MQLAQAAVKAPALIYRLLLGGLIGKVRVIATRTQSRKLIPFLGGVGSLQNPFKSKKGALLFLGYSWV